MVPVLIDGVRCSLSPCEFEAYIRQADSNMETALHLAVQGKHLDVVDYILQADPMYPHEDKNKDLKTPIFIAAEMGYTDLLLRLCRTDKFGYETRGPGDQTALHVAIIGRHTGTYVTSKFQPSNSSWQ